MTSVRVEVKKSKNENSSALIRRFSRRVQGTGLIRMMRKRRTYSRKLSKNVEHKRALVTLKRRSEYEDLVKLGKIEPRTERNSRGPKRG